MRWSKRETIYNFFDFSLRLICDIVAFVKIILCFLFRINCMNFASSSFCLFLFFRVHCIIYKSKNIYFDFWFLLSLYVTLSLLITAFSFRFFFLALSLYFCSSIFVNITCKYWDKLIPIQLLKWNFDYSLHVCNGEPFWETWSLHRFRARFNPFESLVRDHEDSIPQKK